MKIKFPNYKDGLHHFDFETDVEELGLKEKFVGNVLLNCMMDKSSTQIVINCNLLIKAKFACDRCMAEFEKDIKTDFRLIFFITHSRSNGEESESGIYYLSPDEDTIDLTNDTVENILLTLPMKILCDENCKGLCYVCGVNKNETECSCEVETSNPVWDKLLKLKK